ncbi:MAG: hypothetical protein IJY09_03955 [Lachnospiraceae bacterium]|nr:hypothetical protein [Lachnospiraceae bacterium]
MKKYFIVSLCKEGVLGGGMLLDSEKATYKTGKVTVSEKYRNLEMRYEEMAEMVPGHTLFWPTVTIKMKNSEEYKFIVFARAKLLVALAQMGVTLREEM